MASQHCELHRRLDGVVYQKDLGPERRGRRGNDLFDPDGTWQPWRSKYRSQPCRNDARQNKRRFFIVRCSRAGPARVAAICDVWPRGQDADMIALITSNSRIAAK
jgi:hypothetical protein